MEDVCGGVYLIKTWINMMIFKRLFDIIASFCGLLLIWWIFPIIAFLIHKKMPGGPAFFCQKRVGKDGKLFTCHKFRSMTVKHNGSTVSVAGDSRITPFGAKLRHYKLDELPGLWDVLIGNMSFVGPRPDVPGYADKLQGDDRDVLKLRPGITGPATLKYRLEDEMISEYVAKKTGRGGSALNARDRNRIQRQRDLSRQSAPVLLLLSPLLVLEGYRNDICHGTGVQSEVCGRGGVGRFGPLCAFDAINMDGEKPYVVKWSILHC